MGMPYAPPPPPEAAPMPAAAEVPASPVPAAPSPSPTPSNRMLTFLYTLAGLTLLCGAVIAQVGGVLDQPGFRVLRALGFAASVLIDVGIVLVVIGGFLVGIRRTDIDPTVRRALIIGPLVLAIFWLLFFVLGGLFSSGFP